MTVTRLPPHWTVTVWSSVGLALQHGRAVALQHHVLAIGRQQGEVFGRCGLGEQQAQRNGGQQGRGCGEGARTSGVDSQGWTDTRRRVGLAADQLKADLRMGIGFRLAVAARADLAHQGLDGGARHLGHG